MSLLVKICGLSTRETLDAALGAGADMVGFVFFPASPRHLSLAGARELAGAVRGRAKKVALTVDADDLTLADVMGAVKPDILQLHGRESTARVKEIRQRFAVEVMKAVAVKTAADLAASECYGSVCDRILFDARPPTGASRPGGLGAAFDWRLLKNLDIGLPFMVSGGLGAHNVEEALRVTGAGGVDVSSGVECAPGVKDPAMIERFIRAARASDELAIR